MLDLPAVAPYSLDSPPLAQAIAQVRFPLVARLETLAGVAPLQDRLKDEFPYLNQVRVQETTLLIGPAGAAAPQAEAIVVSELTDDEGRLLSVHPGSATLSLGAAYVSIEDFANRFQTVLTALADTVGITRCDRLGVRYLNTIDTQADPKWRDWIRPEMLGWHVGAVSESSALLSAITQTQLIGPVSGDTAAQAIVRTGFAPAGSLLPGVPPVALEHATYFLDFDFVVSEAQRLVPDRILAQFRALHDQIDRLFHWSTTPAGLQHFGSSEFHD